MVNPNKKIISDKDEIWMDKDSIARITVLEGHEFDESDINRQFQSYRTLGISESNTRPIVVDARHGFTIGKEVRDRMAKDTKLLFSAAAVIGNSLSTRIIINFLNSFYDFGLPIKLFDNEQDALIWARRYA